MNITPQEVAETLAMVSEQNLDLRTITMGISLNLCADDDLDHMCKKVYERIVRQAEHLVKVACDLEREYGIPIANKRVSVTPIALVAAASRESDLTAWARMLDEAARAVGVDFIGGFSALVERGATASDRALIDSIPQALAATEVVCSSVNVASSRAGVNMDAVRAMGEAISASAHATEAGLGAAKLVVFANSVGDNPFMAGAFHGVEMPDCVVSVGVSGPGVVKRAIDSAAGEPFDALAEAVKKSAFKVTRMGELVGRMAAERLGVDFGIVDLSLAPTAEVGDSVARALEAMGLERVGAHGTTAALALLNDAVKKGGLMACSHVGGLSGSFIPVSEDEDVRVLEILVLFDLFLHIALGVIRLDADAAFLQKRENLLRVGIMLRSDRDDADLLRGEPEGEDALEVFDDNSDEALQGAVDRPVNDDRHRRYALRGLIAQAEIMRELEVELDGPALPFSPERVLDLEVDLRSVEGPVSLIDLEASLAVLIREDPL